MAERHNEITGGHFHGPVVQAGSIDRVYLQVSGQDEVAYPVLTSWRDRPAPTPAPTDLLAAQRDATESLPYRLLGVKQPELTRVYVQQSVRVEAIQRAPEEERRP